MIQRIQERTKSLDMLKNMQFGWDFFILSPVVFITVDFKVVNDLFHTGSSLTSHMDTHAVKSLADQCKLFLRKWSSKEDTSMAKFSFQNSATLHNRLYRAKMRINRYETGSDKRTGLTGYKIPGFVIYPVPHLIQPITWRVRFVRCFLNAIELIVSVSGLLMN